MVDADSATDVIHKLQAGPDLILVDTRMEGDFTRAVELMRRMPHLNHVGIVMLSGDQSAIKQGMTKGLTGIFRNHSHPRASFPGSGRFWIPPHPCLPMGD